MEPFNSEVAIKIFDALVEKCPTRKTQIENMMKEIGVRFFTAPASGSLKKHDAFPGGLLVHSLQLYQNLVKLRDLQAPEIDLESIIVVALFHDLGKIGSVDGADMYVPTTEDWKIKRGYVYDYNPDLADGLSHAQRSLRILTHYGVKLSSAEYAAILYHDGLYMPENKLMMDFRGIDAKLLHLLHFADYWTVFFSPERLK